MTIRRIGILFGEALVLALAAGGCFSSSGGDPADGNDAAIEDDQGASDAGADQGADLATDAGADAGSDETVDAGQDAGADEGADQGADSGQDAGQDAGADPGADAGWGCDLETCSGHGTCDDGSGAAVCTCADGYGGARCDSCAEGYAPDGDNCIPDATCALYQIAQTSYLRQLQVGGGLDLDDDGQIDNLIGQNPLMPGLVNPILADDIASAKLCLLFEHRGLETPAASAAYSLVLLACQDPDGATVDRDEGRGQFEVLRSSLGDPVCRPLPERTLQAEPVVAGALVARGDVLLGVPFLDLAGIVIPLRGVRLEATLVELSLGLGMQQVQLGGGIDKEEYLAALIAFVEAGGQLPVDPNTLVAMMGEPDLDLNGDGTNDAWSIGYTADATSAAVDGIVVP
jgi:hypothetical protein